MATGMDWMPQRQAMRIPARDPECPAHSYRLVTGLWKELPRNRVHRPHPIAPTRSHNIDVKGTPPQSFTARLRDRIRSMRRRAGHHEAMEVIYRDLFLRELQRLGIEDRFFPVHGAANYGLLYLVLRCYMELPLQRILDVGAGQTSLLLDALHRKLGKGEIVTLEHDVRWAESIGAQVRHQVLRRELIDMRIAGQATRMHDTTGLAGPFQFIIMDAPPGTHRYSRLGLLHLMQTVMDRGDFIAILDDVQRGSRVADSAGVPAVAVGKWACAFARTRSRPPSASGCARAARWRARRSSDTRTQAAAGFSRAASLPSTSIMRPMSSSLWAADKLMRTMLRPAGVDGGHHQVRVDAFVEQPLPQVDGLLALVEHQRGNRTRIGAAGAIAELVHRRVEAIGCGATGARAGHHPQAGASAQPVLPR